MYLVAIVLGLLIGLWVFSRLGVELAGAVCGALLALGAVALTRLHRRLVALERERAAIPLSGTQSPTPSSPAPVEDDDFVFALDEPRPLSVKEAPGRSATVAAGPTPHRARPAPAEQKIPGVELWRIVKAYFTGGNVVARAGAVVLFFGVAFLLKYSAERDLVPIELRLLGVSLGAIALLLCGWRLRLKRPGYALILQGAAVGVLYLAIFAAMKLYHLLPAGLALFLLIVMAVASATLAILQDARMLAVIGIVGGFLAPVLTATGGGSHVLLFGYYALLNGGILITAWHKSWRELNLLGFVFTFGIGALWGAENYRPELFATSEPFLLLFFLFYLAIGILFARNQPLNLKGYVDGTLVFGTPIVCFGLQAALVKPYPYGLAWSALAMGALYAVLARILWRKGSPTLRTLVESFLATGVVFATVAGPLALDGRWTSAAWALEGSAIVWIAIKQRRWMPRLFGLLLQVLAGGAFLLAAPGSASDWPVFNGFCLGGLIVALAGHFSGWCLWRQADRMATARLESYLALTWGLLWWFGAGLHEIGRFAPVDQRLALGLAFCALSAALAFLLGEWLRWETLRRVYLGLSPVMLFAMVGSALAFHSHPSIHGGCVAWPLALLIHYWLLYRDERHGPAGYLRYPHLGLFPLLVALSTWEAAWWVDHWIRGTEVWPLAVLGVVPAGCVLALSRLWRHSVWPLRSFRRLYLYQAPMPIVGYLWLGSLATNLVSDGEPRPLGYLPLFNPFDLAQALVLLALAFWFFVMTTKLDIQPFGLNGKTRAAVAGATVFFWLNAMLLRTLHHWGDVPFDPSAMLASDLTQTALSIFWTLSALAVMLWAARKGVRRIWLVGAGLIGVVIVKLFIFDLAHTSTVERIVSFIGVGGLCLAVGYLAPLPPKVSKGQ